MGIPFPFLGWAGLDSGFEAFHRRAIAAAPLRRLRPLRCRLPRRTCVTRDG